MDEADHTSRRELLRAVARGAVGAALTLGTAALAWKGLHDGEDCIARGVCRGCPRASDCHLPAALSYREVVEKR